MTVTGYLTSDTGTSGSNIVFVIADEAGNTNFASNEAIQVPKTLGFYDNDEDYDVLEAAPVGSLVQISGRIDAYNSTPSLEAITSVTILEN